MEVGFCGPGLMGAPMIRHLLRAGHAVRVWNRTRDKALALVADGAQVAGTPAELARHAEVVLLCVADAAAVEAVVFGPGGLLADVADVAGGASFSASASDSASDSAGATATGSARSFAVAPANPSAIDPAGASARPATARAPRAVRCIVDHSSIPPSVTRQLARRAAAMGVGWVDAPVSGGVAGAQAGTLAVMAGGDAGHLAAVTPLLRAYAARVTHMGAVGTGQTAKLCNQAIVTATVAAIAEAVALAGRSGIDAALLTEALAGGWADSALLQTFVPRMTQPAPQPIGALRTFQKDVDAIAAAAAETGTPMPVSGAVQQVLRLGVAMGLAQADLSGFIDVLQARPAG